MSKSIVKSVSSKSIVEQAKGSFHGGIHPAEFKNISNQQSIKDLPIAAQLVIPVKQQLGQTGEVVVNLGDRISRGQLLVKATGILSANIHSPADGIVTSLSPAYVGHPSGMKSAAITIKTDLEQSEGKIFEPIDWRNPSNLEEIQSRIRQAGIVGLGGATFPTHVKTSSREINTLIVNAMECEPFITCDDRMLKDIPKQVIEGAQIVANLVKAKNIIFATEDNKQLSIEKLSEAISKTTESIPMSIVVAPTKYPSGGEKQTIELVTGKQVPSGKIPASMGLLVQNVATLHAVFNAVVKGQPLYQRLVTITGNLVDRPGNYWIAFGTQITDLIEHFNVDVNDCEKVIIGGPLMGQSVTDFTAPVTKATNCLIFNKADKTEKAWLTQTTEHQPCIRCGECEKVCPADLLPQQLLWYSQSDQWENLQQQGILDCIECGACAYVCPSEIPLVQYYRYGKSSLKDIQRKNVIAEKAKKRFDFKEMRIQREKAERAAKHKKAAEARRQAALDKKNDSDGKQQAINDALARVKQKKASVGQAQGVAQTETDEKKES
ncbi:electron transport complex subunit RsxC [Aliikangiella marina]|uniref:Ion-translocating oxidoreductase complex subunit C n=1 Tax=Aliikangiella marina TaxID=1712262 RepID=A0A545T335_9GAMM|nr:electron transport complex subunit RsxC [Aliikangiella marina]TQV71634.1 electron transport complex subunit RsxC [Aliikangiella marina]